jgi:hypothetical protein
MSNYQPVRNDTFILRVWHESASGTWRGQIVHLPGQESAYFATPAQAIAFIDRFVPGVAPKSDAPAAAGDAACRDPTPEDDQ